MTELKIGPIIMITRTDFLRITARFCRCFIVDGLLFQALALKIFLIFRKICKTQATAPKKQILTKAVLANLETPRKATWKKKRSAGYRYAQINSGYVTDTSAWVEREDIGLRESCWSSDSKKKLSLRCRKSQTKSPTFTAPYGKRYIGIVQRNWRWQKKKASSTRRSKEKQGRTKTSVSPM